MKTGTNLSLTVRPQVEKYRNQNRQLQTEAARLIGERDHLKTVIAPQICAEYKSKIGALELRVFQFECEIRAFVRRIELANAALNRSKMLVYAEIEQEIRTEFAEWREEIARQIGEIEKAKEREKLPALSYGERRELKTLYRKLALRLHPDITGNTDERRRKLWLEASEAYKCGDLQTLRTIRLLIGNESSENDLPDENILKNLKNRNAQLKQICEKLLDEIAEIKKSAPYIWHEILDDAAKLEKCRNDLREKIEIHKEKRRQLIEYWTELLSFAEDCENIRIPEEPPEIFTDETNDWADIIYEF